MKSMALLLSLTMAAAAVVACGGDSKPAEDPSTTNTAASGETPATDSTETAPAGSGEAAPAST